MLNVRPILIAGVVEDSGQGVISRLPCEGTAIDMPGVMSITDTSRWTPEVALKVMLDVQALDVFLNDGRPTQLLS